MRVLHVGKFFPPFAGGMENFLADLLIAQQAQGLKVAALVHHERPGWQGRLPEPVAASSPDLVAGARDDRCGHVSSTWAGDAIPGPAPLIYRAPCLGRLLYVPLSPSFPWWLDRAIREFAPDLLHLHLPNTSAFAALLVPRARRLPWVVHWQSDVVASSIDRRLTLAYAFYRPFEQRLLGLSHAIVTTSPPYLDASRALAPWRDRCVVIPLGLDPARLAQPDAGSLAVARQRWGATGLRILSIGRLTYYKGQNVLIRAALQLPDARILIVGGGERHRPLQSLIDACGLSERVRLTGFTDQGIMAALLASCDLLCLPSLERTEAFGLVLLEAMRYGKPVVVSDIPGSGAPWVVRQAGNGLLTPPGDEAALAQVLRELAGDPARRARLGQAGARALAREFGIGPVAEAIQGLYTQVLGSLDCSA